MTYEDVRSNEVGLHQEMKTTGLNRSELIRMHKIISKIECLPAEAYTIPTTTLPGEISKEYSILIQNDNWLKMTEDQKAYFQIYFYDSGWNLIKITTPNDERPMLRFFLKGIG